MKSVSKQLWKEAAENFVLSSVLFIALLGILGIVQLSFKEMHVFTADGRAIELLQWVIPETGAINWPFIVSIPASIMGVAYILTIRNSNNFTGFYIGLVMSLLLAYQYFLVDLHDLTALYLVVFVVFQIWSIVNWQRFGGNEEKTEFTPKFFSWLEMGISLGVFLVIAGVDYVLMSKFAAELAMPVKCASALLVSSGILANFWIIFKRNDSWIYWMVYSVAGIVLNILILNFFSITLFLVFLIVNYSAYTGWKKNTPADNYGWLQSFKKK